MRLLRYLGSNTRKNYRKEELPERQKRVLRELNIMIHKSGRGMEHLPYGKFETERDLVH